MQEMSIGAGLASLAFWGFVAIVVVAGIWSSIRRREAQHETLRRALESDQPLTPEIIQNILSQGKERLDQDLKTAGLITLFIAPGLAALGWFLSFLSPKVLMPLLGTAALVGFLSIGLLVAAKIAENAYYREKNSFGN